MKLDRSRFQFWRVSPALIFLLSQTSQAQVSPLPHIDSNEPTILPVLRQELLLVDPVNPMNVPTNNDNFGTSVALDGDRAVVGCARDDELGLKSGSVFVYERTSSGWQSTARLTAPDGTSNDNFGLPVAIDADTIVVGANMGDEFPNGHGRVYVFKNTKAGWGIRGMIENPLSSGAAGSLFGGNLAVEGNLIVVSALLASTSGTGTAWAFETPDDWFTYSTTPITPSGLVETGHYGEGIAINNGTVAIGATALYNSSSQGAVHVWEKVSGIWTNTRDPAAPPLHRRLLRLRSRHRSRSRVVCFK